MTEKLLVDCFPCKGTGLIKIDDKTFLCNTCDGSGKTNWLDNVLENSVDPLKELKDNIPQLYEKIKDTLSNKPNDTLNRAIIKKIVLESFKDMFFRGIVTKYDCYMSKDNSSMIVTVRSREIQEDIEINFKWGV